MRRMILLFTVAILLLGAAPVLSQEASEGAAEQAPALAQEASQGAAEQAPVAAEETAKPEVDKPKGVGVSQTIAVVLYLLVLGYLGYLGYRRSKTAEEFLVAGRSIHPYIMALSYGATFISTSAIVGFGGVAGKLGMSLLWLTFLNIFVGIFIAFVFLGGPTRRMGHHLGAHTFPELLGRRYDSRFVQTYAGAVIFLFMPVYAAGVLLGGAKCLSLLNIDTQTGILIFAVILALYIVAGGLRGVMYTDAFQGSLMFIGMVILIIFAYKASGGVMSAHRDLAALSDRLPDGLTKGGVTSLAEVPTLGTPLWWVIVTTIVLGVGIGVLAQPQLAVRFMTVRSKKELNRAVAIGGLFILAMTGGAFVVGALSNVYFVKNLGVLAVDATTPKGDVEKIMPLFIETALPKWFGVLFLLSLLSAALSTLSSQFHAMGTSLGRDIYEEGIMNKAAADRSTKIATQIGVIAGIVITVVLAYRYEKSLAMVIAKSTSLFFALCASTFLPAFALGLFWKRMNRAAAVSSMLVGFLFSAFWLTFMQGDTAKALGITSRIWPGDPAANIPAKVTLASGTWPFVDALIFALPLSFLVAVLVALVTRPMPKEHLDKCFSGRVG